VHEVLATEAPAEGRIAAWRAAMAGGGLGSIFTAADYHRS
jgi:hypothetical protein